MKKKEYYKVCLSLVMFIVALMFVWIEARTLHLSTMIVITLSFFCIDYNWGDKMDCPECKKVVRFCEIGTDRNYTTPHIVYYCKHCNKIIYKLTGEEIYIGFD